MAGMIDCKISINTRFRYMYSLSMIISQNIYGVPLKNKNSKAIREEFSIILTTSKRSIKLEPDRGGEFYNSIFQIFLKIKNIQHHSRYTDKGISIAERVIETIRILFKKPVFLAGNADWVSELSSVIKKYEGTIRDSTKMTPIQASEKTNEKSLYHSQ